jgi:hypothetical protein
MQNRNAKRMRFLYLKPTCFELSKSICLKENTLIFLQYTVFCRKKGIRKWIQRFDSKNGLLLDLVAQVCKNHWLCLCESCHVVQDQCSTLLKLTKSYIWKYAHKERTPETCHEDKPPKHKRIQNLVHIELSFHNKCNKDLTNLHH